MKVSKHLYSHVDQEDQEVYRDRLIRNSDLFDQVVTLIEGKTTTARKKQLSDTSYDSPAWSEKQADLNGYQRALEELKLLLTIR